MYEIDARLMMNVNESNEMINEIRDDDVVVINEIHTVIQ
jgi:hypothetical protein